MLKGALNGNSDSIRKIALLDFKDAVGYDHGAVIVDIINIIGEDSFIKSIDSIDEKKMRFGVYRGWFTVS